MLLSLLSSMAASADDCTERTTGTVTVTLQGTQYTCPNAPKCQDTYAQTKCVAKIDPESGVEYVVLVGPCTDRVGTVRYTDVPDFEDVPNPGCSGHAPSGVKGPRKGVRSIDTTFPVELHQHRRHDSHLGEVLQIPALAQRLIHCL